MSFSQAGLVDLSPRPRPRVHRIPTDPVRLLVCKLVAFFADQGCRAMPAPDWLTVLVAGLGPDATHRDLTLEVLAPDEPDPGVGRRVPVRSIEDGRAAALRAGILDDLTGPTL